MTSDDTVELGELLTFLSDWLGGTENPALAASLHHFVGTDGYNITELRADLARCSFRCALTAWSWGRCRRLGLFRGRRQGHGPPVAGRVA